MTIDHFKPAVPKCWLFLISGMMWSAVGAGMCTAAMRWLLPAGPVWAAGFAAVGAMLALAALRIGFGGLARKNIRRLQGLPERGCFFAFQAWKSYIIIIVMIVLGHVLRHLPVPRTILAVVYTTIGGALLMASFRYYRHLIRLMRVRSRRG